MRQLLAKEQLMYVPIQLDYAHLMPGAARICDGVADSLARRPSETLRHCSRHGSL